MDRIGRQFRKKEFVPKSCPAGIPLSRISVPKSSLQDAQHRASHAIVGNQNKGLLIPIIEDPEDFLEPGDILIYTKTPGRMGKFEHALEGLSHAAVVIDREGLKYHLDSPPYMSSDEFNEEPYHVLRYSLYPPQVQSAADLERWQSDPDLKKKLEAWTTRRERTLKIVQQYAQHLLASGYKYDARFFTEILQPQMREAWRKDFAKECGRSQPELYCSELPLLLYVSAGEPLIKAQSLFRSLNNLEKETIPRRMKKTGQTREEVIQNEIDDQFSLNPAIVRMSDSERSQLRATLTRYLSLKPPERETLLKGLELAGAGIQVPTTPADLFNSIYDTDGYLAYVGTFVGRDCQSANAVKQTPPDGIPDALAQSVRKKSKELETALRELEDLPVPEPIRASKIEPLEQELLQARDTYFLARAQLFKRIQTAAKQPDFMGAKTYDTEWQQLATQQEQKLNELLTKTKALTDAVTASDTPPTVR